MDDGVVYAPSWADERLYALDAETGQERWQFDLPSSPGNPPAVVDGTVIGGTGGRSGGLYAVTGE